MMPLDRNMQDFSSFYIPKVDFDVKNLYEFQKPISEIILPVMQMPRLDEGYPVFQKPTFEIAPSIGVNNYFNPTPVIPKIVSPVIAPVLPSFTPKPIVYTPPVIVATQPVVQPMAALTPKKTISFTVKDEQGATIPAANIAVNGVDTAQTDINGRVTLPNIPVDSSIKISYVGFENNVTTASTIKSIVILKESITMLDQVTIYTKKKPNSNSLLWLIAASAVAIGIYKYSKTGAKVVRAKI